MEYNVMPIGHRKRIALVAHDNKKQDLIANYAPYRERQVEALVAEEMEEIRKRSGAAARPG